MWDHFAAGLEPGPARKSGLENRMQLSLTVNGDPITVDVPPSTLLADLLRETLELTGTHIACDTSQCGACVVHLDGRSVKSCTLLAVSAADGSVTTIEGLADPAHRICCQTLSRWRRLCL
jgi:aerobic-type carbon monoxide dehydrogenase small subunit (CoxS/CutS family)